VDQAERENYRILAYALWRSRDPREAQARGEVLPQRAVSDTGSDHGGGDATALPAVSSAVLGGAENDNL
jgi:hypothetical protein